MLRQHGVGVNRDAAFAVQLEKSLSSFVRFSFVVKDHYQHAIHSHLLFLGLNYCLCRPSFQFTNPRLFGDNPLPHILRTMPKLDSFGFTNCEEVHRIEIHESYMLEVEREPACSSVNLCFQVLYAFRFNSSAEPEKPCSTHPTRSRPSKPFADLTGKECNYW